MKKIALHIFMLSLLVSPAAFAELTYSADQCASLIALGKQTGEDPYQAMREMGMHDMVEQCQKADTASALEEMASGPMYCQSGSLCAKYEFEYASDRKLYEPKCMPTRRCESNYTDKCSVTNDKVKGGKGMVDWTLYAYGTSKSVWEDAKGVKCNQ